MKTTFQFVILALAIIITGCSQPTPVDISGSWFYRLDNNEVGKQQQWFLQKFTGNTIDLPAALRDENIGETPNLKTRWTGSIYDSSWYFRPDMAKYREADIPKFPFWLTPVKRYVGKAWYQNEIRVPENWPGKEVALILERPHWQTEVANFSGHVFSGTASEWRLLDADSREVTSGEFKTNDIPIGHGNIIGEINIFGNFKLHIG